VDVPALDVRSGLPGSFVYFSFYIHCFSFSRNSLMEQEAKLMLVLFSSYPRNNVTAVEPKVVIRDRFMAGDELQQNHAEAVDVALLCQLLRDVVPSHTRTKSIVREDETE